MRGGWGDRKGSSVENKEPKLRDEREVERNGKNGRKGHKREENKEKEKEEREKVKEMREERKEILGGKDGWKEERGVDE